MLTTLSLWGIYFASYLVDYVLILGILICKKILFYQENGGVFWNNADFFTWGVLVLFIGLSIFITGRLRKIEMNTRIRIIPEKNITYEILGYFAAQIITVATTLFTEWWIVINVVLFLFVGAFFVRSKAVHISPIFIFPLQNRIYQSGDAVIITNYSLQEMRMAQEDNPDGIEARELTYRVYYARK